MNKNSDKKTALKLVNKYADGYRQVEAENKRLNREIDDLKANIKINKEIIDGFYRQNLTQSKDIYLSKLKNQNDLLNSQLEASKNEIAEVRLKISYYEEISDEVNSKLRQEYEALSNMHFLLENKLIKKANEAEALKRKISKFENNDDYNFFYNEKEIYVLDPTESVNQIQDELLLYKQIYENLTVHIRENRGTIAKYEHYIQELQNENLKLKERLEFSVLKQKDQPVTVKRGGVENVDIDNYNLVPKEYNLPPIEVERVREGKNFSELSKYEQKFKHIDSEEWNDILRYANLSPEELMLISVDKDVAKLVEALEILSRLLLDKNFHIKLMRQENEDLNVRNTQLNTENMDLGHQLIDLKKQLESWKAKFSHTKLRSENTTSDSLINNTSQIANSMLSVNKSSVFEKYKSSKINPQSRISPNQENPLLIGSYPVLLENKGGSPSAVKIGNFAQVQDLKKEENSNKIKNIFCPSLESVTSNDFKEGINSQNQIFYTNTNIIGNMNINIKQLKN